MGDGEIAHVRARESLRSPTPTIKNFFKRFFLFVPTLQTGGAEREKSSAKKKSRANEGRAELVRAMPSAADFRRQSKRATPEEA